MGLLQDQNYISKQQPMPMSESDSSSVVVSITGETVQLYYSNSGVRTADAGQAAGTVVVGQLASSNILDASGGYIATNRDTSLSFTGTCFTTEIDFPYSQFKDSKDKTWASKLADVTAVMNNGEYCVDYGSGTIYGKKTTTASSLTSVAYKKKAQTVSKATLDGGEDLARNTQDTTYKGTATRITTATTTLCKSGAGNLKRILIKATLGNTVTIYNSLLGSGTTLDVLPATLPVGSYELNYEFTTGCTVVTAGADNITVVTGV